MMLLEPLRLRLRRVQRIMIRYELEFIEVLDDGA